MKKIFRNILIALLLIPISLGFFGCKDDETPPDETPQTTPPPSLSLVLDELEEIIDFGSLSTTITGNASYNYTKKTNDVIIKEEIEEIENLVLKANGSDFYLQIPNNSEYYFSNNILYSREHISDETYGKWNITYNNVLDNIFALDEGMENLEAFIEPLITSVVENIELFNENWTTCRNLINGGYGLDININLTSILNKIQTAIHNTYSPENNEQTLEYFINQILAERYNDVTLESIITDLFGDDSNSEPFITDSTMIRDVLQYLDDEFGFNTYPIFNNMLKIYYLIVSDSGSATSAKMSTSLMLDTTVHSAIMLLRNFVFDNDELINTITEEEVRNIVNEIVDKYLRSETYTVEYLCNELQGTLSSITGKDINLYSLITDYDISNVSINLSIETNAEKTNISKIYGDVDIKLGKDTIEDDAPAYNSYSLAADFNLNTSNWGTTTITLPTIDSEESKNINVYIVASSLSENVSHNETFEIPYITEDIEIIDGEYIFRYKAETDRLYFSPQIVNTLLGIENYEYVDDPERILTFSAEISETLSFSVTIVYIPDIL